MFLIGRPFSEIIAFAITAIFAFAYHEYAHAIVADRLGDSTPRAHGRMSPNPARHLDLFGLIMLFAIGFGWAVTPVNPNRLRGNPRQSMMYVALAGPVANLIMAAFFAVPIRLGLVDPNCSAEFIPTIFQILRTGVWINLLLLAFNLLPIPPLDGFTILLGLLPVDLAYRLQELRQYGTLILFAVLFLPIILGFSIIGLFIDPIRSVLSTLLIGSSGFPC